MTYSAQKVSVSDPGITNGSRVIVYTRNWNEEKKKLCGDVRFGEAEGLVSALTPVPGGVGSVTTAVLCRHVVDAAMKCG